MTTSWIYLEVELKANPSNSKITSINNCQILLLEAVEDFLMTYLVVVLKLLNKIKTISKSAKLTSWMISLEGDKWHLQSQVILLFSLHMKIRIWKYVLNSKGKNRICMQYKLCLPIKCHKYFLRSTSKLLFKNIWSFR